jgi:hypothetical protein
VNDERERKPGLRLLYLTSSITIQNVSGISIFAFWHNSVSTPSTYISPSMAFGKPSSNMIRTRAQASVLPVLEWCA